MLRATFAGFSTALSALQANQKRLDITGQNLANMNTVGYTRQQLETSSLNYTNPVSKYMSNPTFNVGFGTQMNCVSQIRDPYLDAQYRMQMTKSSYTDGVQTALDSLSRILDESSISGIQKAFDNIQSVLSNVQDLANANDAVFESELRSRMQALTNLLNDSANKITEAKQDEFDRLKGEGTSEQGAVEKVNDLLRNIGDLNVQIKRNQIVGQPSLELLDERNRMIDELSSYIPIEVTYYKDDDHSGTYTAPDGSTRDKMYEYDQNGKVIGKKEWPDDLRITMSYKDQDGNTNSLILVNGTEGGQGKNYAEATVNGTRENPEGASMTFTGWAAYNAANKTPVTISSGDNANPTNAHNYLEGGSIQSSIDMLAATKDGPAHKSVECYQYYTEKLNMLANTFATVINTINKDGNGGQQADLLSSRDGSAITAANITVNTDWYSGTVHFGNTSLTKPAGSTDTALNMLEAMKTRFDGNRDIQGIFANRGVALPDLGDKTFSDYMTNVSTVLANDSLANQTALKTNVTVLNGLQDSRDSVSGVSLDEEASNMMTYLSAYNAASRLMTALDEALNTLINNTGLVGR